MQHGLKNMENKLTSAHFTNHLVELIRHGIVNKAWLYWPPGPMIGQVFDKKRCEVEVDDLIKKILEENQ